MSKIGRKPIPYSSAKIDINGSTVSISGPKGEVTHELPPSLSLTKDDGTVTLSVDENTRDVRALWGLHRALIANKVQGVETGFTQGVKIVGLGYKAQASGKKLVFTLGFSHKVDFEVPEGVDVNVDKSGQNLVFSSSDKFKLGNAVDAVCALKPPEPYKGTGIMRVDEHIRRKAGKAKSA